MLGYSTTVKRTPHRFFNTKHLFIDKSHGHQYHRMNITTNDGYSSNEEHITSIHRTEINNMAEIQDGRHHVVSSRDICRTNQRLPHVERTCRRMHGGHVFYEKDIRNTAFKVYSRHLFVSDEHKLLICVPFKCGSSTIFNLLAHHSKQVRDNKVPKSDIKLLYVKENREKFGIRNLADFNGTDILKRLQSYSKILVVRHPLVRVLSFFMDKLQRNNTCVPFYHNDIGRKVILWARDRLTSKEQICANTLTFAEFMDYFAHHLSTLGMERHLVPIHDWCSPCHLQYDWMMKLETGDVDQSYLLKHFINRNSEIARKMATMFHTNSHLHTSQRLFQNHNFERIFEAFKTVNSSVNEVIKQFYRKDLELFGYEAGLSKDGLIARCGSTGKETSNEQSCC